MRGSEMSFPSDGSIDRGAYWRDASEDVLLAAAINAFGEPNKKLSNGVELRFCAHGSKAVAMHGDKRGSWFDHEAQEGGFLRIPDADFGRGATRPPPRPPRRRRTARARH